MESKTTSFKIENSEKIELSKISLDDLWNEIGRRLNIRFGKIQMVFHNGKPSPYANLDVKIKSIEAS